MNGKLVAGSLVLTALIAGGAVWYTQERAFYHEIDPTSPEAAIRLTGPSGDTEPVEAEAFEGIDSASSPLRFRACFTTPMSLATLTDTFEAYPDPEPRIAPRQFPCFDAAQIGADLESGAAVAFLSERNIHPGFDRVVAVYADGRAYAWHQPNESADQ
ncbi:hypothetical protein DEA8626_00627 [Defluviimonas aquaemixtae]|uniref:Histidine kinase n=1 Tax=Albidovulum aquaemixtae TaxID=1542388 RepID=A0A2R8B3F4_9RHOB|nr:DUF6446 family protein [Defluviimonas aquaemixtae]SPH17112.1 hypothetical protein DEA8626_00627 [Defluviimonas aquaemixtae]